MFFIPDRVEGQQEEQREEGVHLAPVGGINQHGRIEHIQQRNGKGGPLAHLLPGHPVE
ncbi:hypothetical protein D3C75_1039810 [compost metagenome]